MTSAKTDKNSVLAGFAVFAAAIIKYFAGKILELRGGDLTAEEFSAKLLRVAPLVKEADDAHALWKLKLEAADAAIKEAHELVSDGKLVVRAKFGRAGAALTEFGMKPAQPHKPTAETQAGAVKKRAATRKARHILGSRQRGQIHAPVEAAPADPQTPPATGGTAGTPKP
jgi:hypothetical protein